MSGIHPHMLAIVFAVIGIFVINTSDAVAKWIVQDLPVFQIMLFQSIGLFVVAHLVERRTDTFRFIRTRDPFWQLLRSLCVFFSGITFYKGLQSLPFADLIAILFISPLTITGMAHVFLKERAGLRRWIACFVGLIGALVIVRPGTDVMGWSAIWPVLAVISWSTYIIVTRRISYRNSTGNMMLWAALVGLFILITTLPLYWVDPHPLQLVGLFLIGLLSATSNGFTIRAYAMAPASLLAPFIYCEMIGATAYGWYFWDEFPDIWTWVGATIIVAAGLYVWRRELQVTRANRHRKRTA